ncbi:MAG: hypothetical protein IGR93_20005 [Hydrococcus sp. C42_A2020_068]|uniref:hypothetical protein n=1 Tax=Pleurocapsa sp. PCC 7327 TaxID=118163 RepID=UPI00029F91F5|nr:hypothetical protein [Pleurocapsa sp. PCC 7327]AFY78493.1 hypothetical protein Ple7327_3272 [Pleurocapsa sp. PCC 7327]MBF2022309.1 hypothetical protein [Hydrococcus sp. C42_A2020_068]
MAFMQSQKLERRSYSLLPKLIKSIDVRASDKGLTMMEVLVGILVSSIVVGVFAPVWLTIAATRIQHFRAEQAMNLAQSEIDRAQVNIMRGVKATDTDKVPPQATSVTNLSDVGRPTATVTSYSALTATKALEVDVNNDGKPDFLVQLFRDGGQTFNSGVSQDEFSLFRMGVRVYSIVAKDNLSNLETQRASLGFTQGLKEQATHPLAVLYAEIVRSDTKKSLDEYKEYLAP